MLKAKKNGNTHYLVENTDDDVFVRNSKNGNLAKLKAITITNDTNDGLSIVGTTANGETYVFTANTQGLIYGKRGTDGIYKQIGSCKFGGGS